MTANNFSIIIIDTASRSRATVATISATNRAEAVQTFCAENAEDPSGRGGFVEMDDIINHGLAKDMQGWHPSADAHGLCVRAGCVLHCVAA